MNKISKPAGWLCLALVLTACQQLASAKPATTPPLSSEGRAFAQATCAGCHAIGRDDTSRRSSAPPFPAIVNHEGLTAKTLSFWLRGAHNYPRDMDFTLRDREVDALVAYMLTLKDPNYVQPPD